ncbi:MAG: phosphoethanolamine transferase [Prevotella sp.]|nr:phosphoethanolamine transferase [Prevotella sp.]
MRKQLSRLCEIATAPVTNEFPLFVMSFIMLNPMWFSALRTNIPDGLRLLITPDNVVTCDLYVTLLYSVFFATFITIVAKCSTKAAFWLKTLIYACLAMCFIVRKFLLWEFDMDYGPQVLSLIMETNVSESQGFVQTFLLCQTGLKYLGLLISVIMTIVVLECAYRRKLIKYTCTTFSRLTIVLAIVIMLPFGIKSMAKYEGLKTYSGENSITGIMAAIDIFKESSKEASKFYETVEQMSSDAELASCDEQGQDIVFVLGESFIKSHASIYGYYLSTMPHMEKEINNGNLYLLDDLISPFPRTTPSFKNIMSLNNLADNEKWCDCAYIPMLFHKAGWNVEMWDNQQAGDRHYVGSFHEMWTPKISSLCYDYISDIPYQYDDDLVTGMHKSKTILNNETVKSNGNQRNNFIFIHLKGEHFPFTSNYPDTIRHFSRTDIKRKETWMTEEKEQAIAEYDNAILYNDMVMQHLFNIFRKRTAVIVYISDHGEEVFDYRDKSNRPPLQNGMSSEYVHCQHDSPCLLWMSDAYQERFSDIVSKVIAANKIPYSHDLIGNMLLTLGHVQSKYYRACDDILSSKFSIRKRVVFPNGRSYSQYYEDMAK